MGEINQSQQPTGPTGWTCPSCKAWVMFGNYHHCLYGQGGQGGNYQQVVNTQPPWWSIDLTLQRIATAFERIATALEKQLESE